MLSAELQFLFISLASSRERRVPENINLSKIDWAVWLSLATTHRVLPLLNQKSVMLAKLGVPSKILTTLKNSAQKQGMHTLLLVAGLIEIGKKLHTEKIPFIAIKGPVFSLQLYNSLTLRSPHDIDIWVHPEYIVAADAIALRLGYTRFQPKNIILPHQWKYVLDSKKDMTYVHPTNRYMLEIHHRLTEHISFFPLQFTDAYHPSQQISLGGIHFNVLSPIHEFIYQCYHGSRSRWARLHWLCDIDRWLQNNQNTVDWPSIQIMARQLEAEDYVKEALYLSKQLLSTNLPAVAISLFPCSWLIKQRIKNSIANISAKSPNIRTLQQIFYEKISPIYTFSSPKKLLTYYQTIAAESAIDSTLWKYLPAFFLKKQLFYIYWLFRFNIKSLISHSAQNLRYKFSNSSQRK